MGNVTRYAREGTVMINAGSPNLPTQSDALPRPPPINLGLTDLFVAAPDLSTTKTSLGHIPVTAPRSMTWIRLGSVINGPSDQLELVTNLEPTQNFTRRDSVIRFKGQPYALPGVPTSLDSRPNLL